MMRHSWGWRLCLCNKCRRSGWERESNALERSMRSMSWVLEREGLERVCEMSHWMVWRVCRGRKPNWKGERIGLKRGKMRLYMWKEMMLMMVFWMVMGRGVLSFLCRSIRRQ